MKKTIILLLVLVMFIVTGCSNSNAPVQSQFVETVTEALTKDPNLIEKFKEDNKVGLRKGDTIIADAVWDSILNYQIEGKDYFTVTLEGTGYGNDRVGLIDADGNMLIKPSYSYIFYYDGPYLVCSKNDEPTDIYDIHTGKVVFQNSTHIGGTVDHYAFTYTYDGGTQVYHISDINTGKVLYENTNTNLKECEKPEYHPGLGFLIKMQKYTNTARKETRNLCAFVSLTGQSVESSSIEVNDELKLVFIDEDRDVCRDGYITIGINYGVYDENLTRIGVFTVNSQSLEDFVLNSRNEYVILADDITPADQPGYVFFNATKREFKPIPGAVSAGYFSEGMAVIRNSENLFGYINDTGDIVYSYQFENAEPFKNGQATVVKDYRKQVIDKSGDDREALYQQAGALEAQGDYSGAYQIYMQIPDYSDVQEKLSSPKYVYARKQMEYHAGALANFGNYYGEITWLILEQKDDRVMMISRDVLDFQPYHKYDFDKQVSAVWSRSYIKNWLNTEFLEQAFSAEQQDAIIDTGIGRVFLLSSDEVNTYKKLLDDEPQFTPHAAELRKQHYPYTDPTDWLLRNETDTTEYSARSHFVYLENRGIAGIRPVIWLPLSSLP